MQQSRVILIRRLVVGWASVIALATGAMTLMSSCATTGQGVTRTMECTAYCACGECNGYERGSWRYLKLDFWNRYINYGSQKDEIYTGRTAGGGWLRTPEPGLFSFDSLRHPLRIPFRIILPWKWLPRDGTIAADTDYYPFGTRMYVPGWGWGVVDDVGGAIQGRTRLDLFHGSERTSSRWGRQHVEVRIYPPN